MFKYAKTSKNLMAISQWFESTFSSDKFDARKALRHTKKEYSQFIPKTSDFDEIFLELANNKIEKNGKLLYSNEIDNITQRARVRAKHRSRNQEFSSNPKIEEHETQDEINPYSTAKLNSEFFNRLLKQLQSVKTTTNVLLNDGEMGSIRNLKMKTAEDTILKIIQEMNEQLKARSTSSKMERTLKTEITRWTNFSSTVHKRLDRKISGLDFKDYVNDFEKSFRNANS